MDIVIERARYEQSEELLKLNKSVWCQAYKGIVDDEIIAERFERRLSSQGIKHFAEYIESCTNFYVAVNTEDNKIVGYVDFGMCRLDEKYKDHGEIYAIYVSPDCQRGGIGQKLLDFAIEYFKQRNINKIFLTTFQKNMIGLNFYKNNNFIIIKELPKGTWHDNAVDELLLSKEI